MFLMTAQLSGSRASFQRIVGQVLAGALLVVGLGGLQADEGKLVTVITGVRIIDGTGKAPVEDGTVVVEGERLAVVGTKKAKEWAERPGARQVDGHGLTMIPGLISDHSHVGLVNDGKFQPGKFTRESVEAALQKYAGYGVTTVMSLGMNDDGLFAIRDDRREGRAAGAKVLSAGRGIGFAEGAPPFEMPSEQLFRVKTAEEGRDAVRAMAEKKTDMIKLWTDTVYGKTKRMPPDILAAIVDESHRAELKVAAHLFFLDDAKALLKDGLDIVAHSVRDQVVDEEFIALMKKNGATYIPTLTLDESQFAYADRPEWMKSAAFREAATPALLEKWEGAAYVRQVAVNPDTPKNREALATAKKNVKVLHDAGVMIGFGTDSGANPNRLPGWAEHRELQLYVDAGLTPMEALTCATRNAAEILGLLEDRGTLEAGKRADFILLKGNPLEDIRNTLKIATIYQDGQPISPAFPSE